MKRAFPFFGLILILIWVIACTVPESKATPTPGAIVLSDQEGWYPLGLQKVIDLPIPFPRIRFIIMVAVNSFD